VRPLRWLAFATSLSAVGACEEPGQPASSAAAPLPSPATATAVPSFAPELPTGRRPTAASSTPTSPPKRVCAPSLLHEGPLDPRDADAGRRCQRLPRARRGTPPCGSDAGRRVDERRFVDAVPELTPDVLAKVRATFDRGRDLGRNPRAFGLVGDSITVSHDFLREAPRIEAAGFVREALSVRDGTVVDFFRDVSVEAGRDVDSFQAFRAAKVGARAAWALDPEERPLAELLRRVNPAYVVVAFGANDAAYRRAPPEEIADEFERHVRAIVETLLREGVIPILSNEMRHGDQPGVKACPADGHPNDWEIAVATNATSARMAEVACQLEVPLVDLRHALDGAFNFGLGGDSVHLSTFGRGSFVLDHQGLDCGNNVRNYVTLLGLARVVRAVGADQFPTGAEQ
jgi:hypothetical protein